MLSLLIDDIYISSLWNYSITIVETVKNGEEIRLMGFGTFKKSHRNARKGRNPQTGAEMEIPASDVLTFSSKIKY